MDGMTKAKMFEMLSEFADSLPDDGEDGSMGSGGDMASGDMEGSAPSEVEISVESKPEGMGGEKMCPHCGKPY